MRSEEAGFRVKVLGIGVRVLGFRPARQAK